MLALLFDILYCRIYLLFSGLKATTYTYAESLIGRHELDVYLPDKKATPAPVIVFLLGGGWELGSRKNFQSGILSQIKRGFAVVGVSYSFSQQAAWPTQLHEVKAAIRWLRARAEELHLDTNCIILWGISAGGHIASVVGASNELSAQEGTLGQYLAQSSEVHAVVAWYPPTDFTQTDDLNAISKRGFYRATKKLLRATSSDYTLKAQAANPISYINKATPPFFIQHGSWDQIVPEKQSRLLYDALKHADIYVEYERLSGYVHADLRFNNSRNLTKVNAFLDKIVGEN
ncbi:MAG: alpha/beta hydrolase [Bacteroidota bacterium]